MPIETPTFPGEIILPLANAALTSEGCVNPGYAIDNNTSTYADFTAVSSGSASTPSVKTLPGSYPTATFVYNTYVIGYFGQCFDPGLYYVVYLQGAMDWNTGAFWSPAVTITDGIANHVTWHPIGGNSTNGPTYWNRESDVEAAFGASAGYTSISFVHEGGPIGVMNPDNVISDNLSGYPQPTFALLGPFPRFLEVDWTTRFGPRWITRIRLEQQNPGGPSISDAGISYISAFGSESEVPIQAFITLPLGNNTYELYFDPPVLALGINFYPDYYGIGSSLPEVDLYQLQVYENSFYDEGETGMGQTGSNPTYTPARVGCSGLNLYSWVASSSYPFANPEALFAIQGVDFDIKGGIATVRGGDTIYHLGKYETDRSITCKFTVEEADMRVYLNTLGGTLIVDGAGTANEQQYFTSVNTANVSNEHAPYFSLLATSINGDPTEILVIPKCKYTGFTRNWATDKPTDYEVSFEVVYDKTYKRQDGQVGAPYEFTWNNSGNVLPPS